MGLGGMANKNEQKRSDSREKRGGDFGRD